MNNSKDKLLRVLITRPQQQAEILADLIITQGFKPIIFPVLEIFAPIDNKPLQTIAQTLEDYDMAIFISSNAVQYSLNTLLAERIWPESVKIASIGKGTSKMLAQFNCSVNIQPEKQFNSEGLLEHPDLQKIENKKIIIFRGDGGRELLGDTLQQRGAQITYIEAYKRGKPQNTDITDLMRTWSREGIDAIVITSNEAMRNLYDILGKLGQMWLRKTPVIVLSERNARLAKELGCKEIKLAEQASDEGILATLLVLQQES